MLAPAADDDLGAAVVQAIVALEFLNDGFLEFGDTAGWSVLVNPSWRAAMAASLIGWGVSKSGSPAPKPMTSCPAALNCLALALMARVGKAPEKRRAEKS